tara:strand:+ start:52 stop:471 length:420 start_codon:yes stop_codon:yes gene_type:complete
MSYQEVYQEIHFFPSSNNATISILDEVQITNEMREYLQCQPTKGRVISNWIWNAPQGIMRTPNEPGYAFAYTDLGMGHWDILYWNHGTNRWHTRRMGGSNGHDATDKYTALITNGFEDIGVESTIEEWMTKFKNTSNKK